MAQDFIEAAAPSPINFAKPSRTRSMSFSPGMGNEGWTPNHVLWDMVILYTVKGN